MSLLIKGADISSDHIQCITVFPEGFAVVEEYEMGLPIKTTKCEVASVPTPHGRLIDADALITTFCEWGTRLERGRKLVITMCKAKQAIVDIIEDAPTVIQAEE